jgi:hypothetical protein
MSDTIKVLDVFSIHRFLKLIELVSLWYQHGLCFLAFKRYKDGSMCHELWLKLSSGFSRTATVYRGNIGRSICTSKYKGARDQSGTLCSSLSLQTLCTEMSSLYILKQGGYTKHFDSAERVHVASQSELREHKPPGNLEKGPPTFLIL